jgi:hypothetical protein
MWFGLVNRFLGYSQFVIAISSYTLKIAVTMIHEITPWTLQLFSCPRNSLRLTASRMRLHKSTRLQTALPGNTMNFANESEPESDGQSSILSCSKTAIWRLRPHFYYCQTVASLLIWVALCHKRVCLLFTIAAGPHQRSHSELRVQRNSWPYCTVSDSRFPFSSPPTIRRVTVEVLDPAFTRDLEFWILYFGLSWLAANGK